jgi:signal transduction histidine kinase
MSERRSFEEMEEDLKAQERTIAVLINAAERYQQNRGSAISLLHDNVALEKTVESRTRELEFQRHELERALLELRSTQNELLQAQKLTAIGQLAAGIAHEINTPMQFINDNITFLADSFQDLLAIAEGQDGHRGPDDLSYLREEIPRAIEQTKDGIQRVISIVQAMKRFSHPSGGQKEMTDVHECLDSTAVVAGNTWKYVAELQRDYDRSCPLIPMIRDEFNQVILNLLVNAADAIGDTLKAGAVAKGIITLRTRRLPKAIEIQVQDTGTGIPESIRFKVFDPFFTTKGVGKGSGQGLAITYSIIVGKHGGEIGVDSEVGKGTTFWIRLPLEADGGSQESALTP